MKPGPIHTLVRVGGPDCGDTSPHHGQPPELLLAARAPGPATGCYRPTGEHHGGRRIYRWSETRPGSPT